MAVNPEAVAWYLQRSEALLADHRERVAALRGRAGQLAGFAGAVLTLAGADAGPILANLHGAAQSCAGVFLLVGSALLVAACVTALRWTMIPRVVSGLSVYEVDLFATDRFVEEPDPLARAASDDPGYGRFHRVDHPTR